MELLKFIIPFSLLGGLFSTVGGVLLIFKEKRAKSLSLHLISFAAGALLGTAFLNLIPEALKIASKDSSVQNLLTLVLVGLVFFFLFEGIFFRFHHHGHEKKFKAEITSKAPWLLTIADSIHNFIDGITLTAAFLVSVPLGITTTIAIAAHEIPQEIGDVSLMIHAGWKRKKILILNTLSSLMTVLGAIIAFALKQKIEPITGPIMALAAGFFIYIAASDIIPEIHEITKKEKKSHISLLFLLGIIAIALISKLIPE